LDHTQGAEGFATALDLGGAGLDTLRAAAGTEAVLDTGLVLALLAQGLPRWFLSREGARLLLKMVETGIAAELLKQGNLIKVSARGRGCRAVKPHLLCSCVRLWPSQPPLEIKQSPGRALPNGLPGQWEVRELRVGVYAFLRAPRQRFHSVELLIWAEADRQRGVA